jgi:major vault protein
MADIQGQTQLVLAQNQHALIQDTTKGIVQVYAGPHSGAVSQNERPVTYDRNADMYVGTTLQSAVKQNPFVGEGEYLVLENPNLDKDGKPQAPGKGGNAPADLRIGSKINITGPITFPLWPGQFAQVIPGHHLRSNQYLVVRVYNADEASKNATKSLKSKAAGLDGAFTPGQQLVIKGTESSFFIPPTGFEVLQDSGQNPSYVREALTLERLEYCILLDEDGNKRFEMGPQVVFPEATERFVEKESARKLKAIELNDQMGVYVKVTADYNTGNTIAVPEGAEEGTEFKHNLSKYRVMKDETGNLAVFALAGEELFITGKEQRFYYPRAEHVLIGYDDPKTNFKRERYYGITIPTGEARYVLDKSEGKIKLVEGPQIFLPDPRNETIVRRVLDDKTVNLWFPKSVDALAFNQSLRALNDDISSSYLAENTVLAAAADIGRSVNRGLTKSKAFSEPVASGYGGDRVSRGMNFTPPPSITLGSKYDGVPSISIWTGYAVQVVDKSGNRRVVVGPATILLKYDETLEMFSLSTGKPKTTDDLCHDVYLRIDNSIVSDIVRVETKDMVNVDLKVQYRLNFLRTHEDKWFAVENYVKYLCDHMRSLLKAALKKHGVKDVMENSATLIRDVVLGKKEGDESRHRLFTENGMDVYDVEVLSRPEIVETRIKDLLTNAEVKAVESAITLASDEQTLINTRRKTEINREIAELETKVTVYKQALAKEVTKAEAEADMVEIEAEVAAQMARLEALVAEQSQKTAVADAEFERTKMLSEFELSMEKERVGLFEKKLAAVTPNLIQAIQTLGDNEVLNRLTVAIAPLAVMEQTSTDLVLGRLFKGSALEPILSNLKDRAKTASAK